MGLGEIHQKRNIPSHMVVVGWCLTLYDCLRASTQHHTRSQRKKTPQKDGLKVRAYSVIIIVVWYYRCTKSRDQHPTQQISYLLNGQGSFFLDSLCVVHSRDLYIYISDQDFILISHDFESRNLFHFIFLRWSFFFSK
jgi:hypothetical protein